jgi:hypothetical protein
MGKIQRFAWAPSAGRTDCRLGLDWKLAATQRTRRAGGIRIEGGIEGIAAPADLPSRGLLSDWGDRSDGSRLIIRVRLCGRQRARIGLSDVGLTGARGASRCLATSLKRSQTLFELAIAILQFLVLPGELAQLIFKLLNPHLRVDLIGLRLVLRQGRCLHAKTKHRGQRRGARNILKSG